MLQNNGGNDLTVAANATTFTFTTALATEAAYLVTILTQPSGLTCAIAASTESGTVAAGNVTTVAITCVVATGLLDTTFGTNGVAVFNGGSNDRGVAVTFDSSGNIIVTGTIGINLAVWRYTSAGVLDTTFNAPNGNVTQAGGVGQSSAGNAVAVDAAGNIVVAGTINTFSFADMALLRFTSAGVPDTTFDTDGLVTYDGFDGSQNDTGEAVAIDSGGTIWVAGSSHDGNPPSIATLWAFDGTGAPNTGVGTAGVATFVEPNGDDTGLALAFGPTNTILMAGAYNGSGAANDIDMGLWRFTSAGGLDNTFGPDVAPADGTPDGFATHSGAAGGINQDRGTSMAVDSSGNIYVAGGSDNGTTSDMVLWRYTAAGVLDTTFGADVAPADGTPDGFVTYGGGFDQEAAKVLIDSSGNVIVVGYIRIIAGNSTFDMAIWRFTSTGAVDTTFGTNGLATFDGAAGKPNNRDAGLGAALDGTGNIVVVGFAQNTSPGADEDMVIWRVIP